MKYLKIILIFILSVALIYGVGRLFFALTDGFLEKNIISNKPYDPQHDTFPLSDNEKKTIQDILSQKFTYLGKGCQSYVFQSEDGKYVIKFLKYQRFKPQPFLFHLTFLPGMETYLNKKIATKQVKLNRLFQSWKLASDYLKKETGVIYVHLNKTDFLQQKIHVKDKLGFSHTFDADQIEFLIQKNVKMICPAIKELMKQDKEEQVKTLLVSLVDMILAEYSQGFGDRDHALMQNTGFDQTGNPIHVDVGLFTQDNNFKNSSIYKHELFSKTYKFRIWLKKNYPSLEEFLTQHLFHIIGSEMRTMIPKLVTLDEGMNESPIQMIEQNEF